MLGVFSSAIVSPPDELVAAGSRTPSPKITANALINRFVEGNASAVSIQVGDNAQLAYSHDNESPIQPRYSMLNRWPKLIDRTLNLHIRRRFTVRSSIHVKFIMKLIKI